MSFNQVREAPSSIDRSSNEAVQEDSSVLEVGELLRIKHLSYPDYEGPVYLSDPGEPNENLDNVAGTWENLGTNDLDLRWKIDEPGLYTLRKSGEVTGDGVPNVIDQFRVEPAGGSANAGEENTGEPSDWVNTEEPSESSGPKIPKGAGVVALALIGAMVWGAV